MRKFFQDQLEALPSAGIRQAEFLTQEQITKLLDDLVIVSEKNFKYIPIPIQENEIKKQIIQDPDFAGITTRWLFKILTKIAEPYWRSKFTEEELSPEPILEGERRDFWLSEWKKSLDQMQANFTNAGKGGGTRLKESIGQEKSLSIGVIKNYEIGKSCDQCGGTGLAGPSIEEQFECTHCNGKGQTDIVTIPATSEESARKQYKETFEV